MVADATFAQLRESFRGQLLEPGDADYDSARRVWNATIDRHPAVIARCSGVADVIDAVMCARESGLPVAVRGGGHNVAGNAVCDDGIVIDLSHMRGLRVDPDARTVRAQGGVTWGLFDRETQAFGLASAGGVVSTTGIAGLTLGGGLGWLSRKVGTACDNLISADVVTAAGELVTANEQEHADLFWGLRGGGGNFGVVTSFEYRLHPVGPLILGGAVFHRGDDAAEVLRFVRDFVATAPEELMVITAMMTAAEVPFLPVEVHGQLVVALAACYAGDLAAGEEAIRPLRAFGRPLADLLGPMPYTALQAMFDESYPAGQHNYWKSNYFDELSDDAITTLVEYARGMPSPLSGFYFQHLGGAISHIDENATAFGHRDHTFDFTASSIWTDPADADENIQWTRDFWEALQPFASDAVYVNNLGAEGDDRVRAAYSRATYDRLVALKDTYDPTNLFQLNQNIRPSRAAVTV